MKLRFAIALLALLPEKAFALDSATYSRTVDVFIGGNSQEDFIARYSDRILSDLQGKWVGSGGISSSDFDKYLPSACASKNFYTISGVSAFGFDMIRGSDPDRQIHTHFTLMIGNTFIQTTPQDEIIKSFSYEAKPELDKRVAASYQNGLSTIIRPDPDIIVIQRNYTMPNIYLKCHA